MPNAQKTEMLSGLREEIASAKAMVVTEYRGLTVAQITDLRNQLRKGNVKMLVAKNTLLRLAVKDTGFEPAKDMFKGPIAVAISETDMLHSSKVLSKFAKANENLKVRGGVSAGKAYSPKEVEAIATLPSREQLLSMLLSTMQGPIRNFAGVLHGVMRQFVGTLDAVRVKKEKEGK